MKHLGRFYYRWLFFFFFNPRLMLSRVGGNHGSGGDHGVKNHRTRVRSFCFLIVGQGRRDVVRAACERVMDILYVNDVQFHGTMVTSGGCCNEEWGMKRESGGMNEPTRKLGGGIRDEYGWNFPPFLSPCRDEGGGVEEGGGNRRRWKREEEKRKNFLEQRK